METQERPFKDERDRQIDISADRQALEFVKAGIQVFTIACLLRKNPAWRAGLSLLFIGGGAELFYKYEKYNHDFTTFTDDTPAGGLVVLRNL